VDKSALKQTPGWLWIVISGLLTVSAFPPSPFGFLAYFGLVPFLYVLVREDFQLAFEKGLLFGIVLNLGVMYWLAFNMGTEWYWSLLSMIASVLFLALNYGLIGFLVGVIGRRLGKTAAILTFPVLYTAVEFVRSFGTLGFTWNNLCYTQSHALQLIQMASFTGPFGISLWIAVINVLIYGLLFTREKRRLMIYVSVLLLLFLIPETYGLFRLRMRPAEQKRELQVGLIQPNVDPNAKWGRESFDQNMQLLHDLTDLAAAQPLDLVVWPETATPTYLRRNWRGTLDKIFQHITRLNVHLLTGAPDYEFQEDGNYRVYNSTFFLKPDSREIEDYRKNQLVPMGEYVPLNELFPALRDINLGQGNFSPGEDVRVFGMPVRVSDEAAADTSLQFCSAICFESSFSQLIRRSTHLGAELLVIVSNDSWFGLTSGPYLHAEIARFRAIENNIPVVRSANTGVSMIIDSRGRVQKKLEFGRSGWLADTVAQGNPDTFFVKFGNWIGCLCVGIAGSILLISIAKRKI